MSVVNLEWQMKAPSSLAETLDIYAQKGEGWKLFAGGTDIMVEIHAGRSSHARFLSLHKVRELRGIQVDKDFVTMGATTTYKDIVSNAVIGTEFPNLRDAARWTGAVAIQSRGTIGGNIGNASPAADSPPALICYDAEIELASIRGRRWISYSEFHTGYKTTLASSDEIITRIRLPRRQEMRVHYYRKVGPRKALAISKVSLAAVARLENGVVQDIRVAFSSLAPTVLKGVCVGEILEGQSLTPSRIAEVCRVFRESVKPIDDVRSTAAYRGAVATNLLKEFLESLL
jgi:CO/xanthine dehydrogenase FAD-binding subunit